MSFLTQFISGSGAKFKSQIFTSSGTFTPSAGLLAAGGVVALRMAGGGGGGGGGDGSSYAGIGGSSSYWEGFTTITGAVTVTIGAGGAAGTTGSPATAGATGGTTSFGSVSVDGGGGGSGAFASATPAGAPGGYGYSPVINPMEAYDPGFFSAGATGNRSAPTANTGAGGSSAYYGSTAGSSGYVQVFWME